jgi:hypothetical protein
LVAVTVVAVVVVLVGALVVVVVCASVVVVASLVVVVVGAGVVVVVDALVIVVVVLGDGVVFLIDLTHMSPLQGKPLPVGLGAIAALAEAAIAVRATRHSMALRTDILPTLWGLRCELGFLRQRSFGVASSLEP